MNRSDLEITKWTRIVAKTGDITRLKTYLGSLALGREFGESSAEYFERTNLTEFILWAMDLIGERK